MKKRLRRIGTALFAATLAFGTVCMAGCGGAADYSVGILQLVQHVSLDQSNDGFRTKLDELAAADGKTIRYYNKNACGDMSNCVTIAQTFDVKNVDVMLGIATPATQALAGASHDRIPVLFTAVTDPVSAKLVQSNDAPVYNVTGVSDINPVAMQIKLAHRLAPKGNNKIGFLYCNSEFNSQIQLDLALEAAEKLGVEIVKSGINDLSEVTGGYNKLVADGVGAIYLPTDNLMASAVEAIHSFNKTNANLPIVCGATGMTEVCGIATYGVDYCKLGEMVAVMAYDILAHGKRASEMPVQNMLEGATLYINEAIAAELGYTIPDDILAEAKLV